jgi:hypothetical protein
LADPQVLHACCGADRPRAQQHGLLVLLAWPVLLLVLLPSVLLCMLPNLLLLLLVAKPLPLLLLIRPCRSRSSWPGLIQRKQSVTQLSRLRIQLLCLLLLP